MSQILPHSSLLLSVSLAPEIRGSDLNLFLREQFIQPKLGHIKGILKIIFILCCFIGYDLILLVFSNGGCVLMGLLTTSIYLKKIIYQISICT